MGLTGDYRKYNAEFVVENFYAAWVTVRRNIEWDRASAMYDFALTVTVRHVDLSANVNDPTVNDNLPFENL